MHLGYFTMPIHPLGKDWRQCLREDREAFLLADELGFTEGYCGEHATDAAENITSCSIFLASLAGATQQIRLGTGTVNMPNTHPAAVAAEIAMLDHLLDGRFNFGISPGGLLSHRAHLSRPVVIISALLPPRRGPARVRRRGVVGHPHAERGAFEERGGDAREGGSVLVEALLEPAHGGFVAHRERCVGREPRRLPRSDPHESCSTVRRTHSRG